LGFIRVSSKQNVEIEHPSGQETISSNQSGTGTLNTRDRKSIRSIKAISGNARQGAA
jgi:hypothetical protein